MPQDASQQTSPAPAVCSGVPRHRDPPVFTGADDVDVDDWLTTYERVSAHNKWDESAKLSHVLFYLAGVASLWYSNHEADLPTWSAFKTSLGNVFGRPAVRKLRAEQRLRERAQQPGESFTSYIEDILDLCKRVDARMSETDRIRNVLKGIEDEAFNMLLAKSPQSVAEIVTLCQSYEELRRQRSLTRRPSLRNEHLAGLTATNGQASLLAEVKSFVREEIARQLSLMAFTQPQPAQQPSSTLVPPLQHAIEQEIAAAIPEYHQHLPAPAPLSYSEVVARPQPITVAAPLNYTGAVATPQPLASGVPPIYAGVMARPRLQPSMQSYQQPHRASRPAPATRWRTSDNQPICFACGYAGHIARYCNRVQPPRATSPIRSQPSHPYYDTPSPTSPTLRSTPVTRRSPSPRRRSLSPMRPRPVVRNEEN